MNSTTSRPIIPRFRHLGFTLKPLLMIVGLGVGSSALHAQRLDKPCLHSKAFEADRDTGHIKVFRAGAADFGNTFERLMMERYGVEIVETQLFGLNRDMVCYNQFSVPYIHETHGAAVLSETEQEARALDARGLGDCPARLLPDVLDSIQLYFSQRVDPELYKPFLPSVNNRLEVYSIFSVDAEGRFTDISESTVRKYPIDSVFRDLTQQMPFRAEPATDDGRPGAGRVQAFLYFDEASMRIYQQPHSSGPPGSKE